jgi:hypothetical protein
MSDDPLEVLEMSPAAYARHRGVSRQAINNLLRREKIPFRQVGSRTFIDAAAADRALGDARERVNIPVDEQAPSHPFGAFEPSGLTKAKTATEVYNARIKQLEYEERVSRLLPVEGVTGAMERCAAAIVRDLDQLPNYAEELAHSFNTGGIPSVRTKLKEIARMTRTILAETMRHTAATSDQTKTEYRS